MNEPQMDAVMQRLERLEGRLRRWKVLGSAAVAVLGLVVLLGATGAKVPEEIRAKRFILVDQDGGTRAELSMDNTPTIGGPSLRLFGKGPAPHVPGAELKLTAGVPSLSLIGLGQQDGGLALLLPTQLFVSKSERSVEMGVERDGSLNLLLSVWEKGREGKTWLSVGADGTSRLGFADSENARAVLALEPSGPHLALAGKDGKTRAWLGLMPNAEPRLEFADRNAMPRAALGSVSLETEQTGVVETRPASSLVFFGTDRKVIWKAP